MTEYFDILNPDGTKTGQSRDRDLVHRDGDWHACVHVWIYDPQTKKVLLQLRHPQKDSYPRHFDVSCAGHLSAGDEPLECAQRELEEELGLRDVHMEHITTIPQRHVTNNGAFIDNEYAHCYVIRQSIDVNTLTLQETEVSGVSWIPLERLCELYRANARDETQITLPLLKAQHVETKNGQITANVVPIDDVERYISEVLQKLPE